MTNPNIIYTFKNVNIYEYTEYFAGDKQESSLIGTIINISQKKYLILDVIQERVDWGRDHQPVRGVYFKLIMTDDERKISSKEILQNIEKHEEIKMFKQKLKVFLDDNPEIEIEVLYDQKDIFRTTYPGRSIWNKDDKKWFLKHQYADFQNLSKDTFPSTHGIVMYNNEYISVETDRIQSYFHFRFRLNTLNR
jgi:hypothetical protein